MPSEIRAITELVGEVLQAPLGIHAHNDCGLAVANSLAGVEAGATHVQGTINGYGERCGNANLCSVIPNLQVKMGHRCISPEQLATLTDVSHYVSEIANLIPESHAPFVGHSAFTHKGGTHVNALLKWAESYQHVDPAIVGNRRRVIVSELAGKSNVISKVEEFGLAESLTSEQVSRVVQEIKNLEAEDFSSRGRKPPWSSCCGACTRAIGGRSSSSTSTRLSKSQERTRRRPVRGDVKVRVKDSIMPTAADGNGPVNALDQALRKALMPFYPKSRASCSWTTKCAILDPDSATAAHTRVLLQSKCGERSWSTVGSSPTSSRQAGKPLPTASSTG